MDATDATKPDNDEKDAAAPPDDKKDAAAPPEAAVAPALSPPGMSRVESQHTPEGSMPTIMLSTVRAILPSLLDRFTELDADDSGTLSFEEFELVMADQGLSSQQARQVFTSIDVSNDGLVTLSEIEQSGAVLPSAAGRAELLQQRKKAAAAHQAKTQRRGSMVVTPASDELSAVLLAKIVSSLPQLLDLFQKADSMPAPTRPTQIPRHPLLASAASAVPYI